MFLIFGFWFCTVEKLIFQKVLRLAANKEQILAKESGSQVGLGKFIE